MSMMRLGKYVDIFVINRMRASRDGDPGQYAPVSDYCGNMVGHVNTTIVKWPANDMDHYPVGICDAIKRIIYFPPSGGILLSTASIALVKTT